MQAVACTQNNTWCYSVEISLTWGVCVCVSACIPHKAGNRWASYQCAWQTDCM